MLTDSFVKKVKTDLVLGEKYSDGGGLYLHVKPTGKYWRMNYRFDGKQKTLSFGVYPDATLAVARARRDDARRLLDGEIDPSEVKQQKKIKKIEDATSTFMAVAVQWHLLKCKQTEEGTSAKRITQLENHVFPRFGDQHIASIKPPQILLMLQEIAGAGSSYTATRIREICAQVFRYGIQNGRCEYNPADQMKGAVIKDRVKHRPAITNKKEFGQFVRDLKNTDCADLLTRLAGRMGLYTWTRPGELRFARWPEFDLQEAVWRIPAERMKTGKHLQDHIVPLSSGAIAVLHEIKELVGESGYLFPARTSGKTGVISENTVNNVFRRMGYADKQSHHGLRASARSLLAERGWARDALQRQLDHREADMAVAAYARSEHLDERKRFMQDWSNLVAELEHGAEIIPLPTRAA